jgi:hypothetical protein
MKNGMITFEFKSNNISNIKIEDLINNITILFCGKYTDCIDYKIVNIENNIINISYTTSSTKNGSVAFTQTTYLSNIGNVDKTDKDILKLNIKLEDSLYIHDIIKIDCNITYLWVKNI